MHVAESTGKHFSFEFVGMSLVSVLSELGARGVQGLVTLWTLLSPAHHTIRIERKRLVSLQSIDVLSAPRPETRHTGHTTYSPPANRHVLGALEPSGIHFCFRGSFQRVAKPFQIDHQRATLH